MIAYGPLTQSWHLSTLPYDVLEIIYNSIERYHDRNALLTTCGRFYGVWNGSLYETAVQQWPGPTAKWTIKHGRAETLEKLLDTGLPLVAVHVLGLLFQAVKHNKEGIVQMLVSYGAEIELSNRDSGMTPLVQSIAFGRDSIAAFLFEQGAGPNNGGEREWRPLNAAAFFSRAEVAAQLLEKRARLNNTLPLAEALRWSDCGIHTFEVLLRRAPRDLLHQTDEHACTILDRAVEANNSPAAG
ncbi:hypothetical protein BJX65DRAFT_307563 [Aspergillus insuetus]